MPAEAAPVPLPEPGPSSRRRAARRLSPALLAVILACPAGSMAQDGPMSAIDWLSDSVATPAAPSAEDGIGETAAGALDDQPIGTPGDGPTVPGSVAFPGFVLHDPGGPAITFEPVSPVAVAPLGAPDPDLGAIGILAPAVTGLPAGLWGVARPEDVARRIRAERPEMLPALQALLQTILLAELDPPGGPGGEGDGRDVFLARVDKLLEMGALEQANALLDRAPRDDAEIIRRHFDVALLLGEEQPLCEVLAASPQLSPTYQARIFCLARAGNWSGAALLFATGTALDLISAEDAALFERFLDPELFEGEPPLAPPRNPTPLTFRMFEAIGQAIPTQSLPLAFAHSDLRSNVGWKARIEAGERLARTGAVSDNQLYGLYSERRAAASGGVWDRVAALQAVERAMQADYRAGTAEALPPLWDALAEVRVEVPIARILGPKLAEMKLDGAAGQLAFRMALLSDDYEAEAVRADPTDDLDVLLVAIARGMVTEGAGSDPRSEAVVDGFTAPGPPARLAALVESDRLGEAILRALSLLAEGTSGDLDQVTDALALLRAVGLEDTARRTALEFLILDRQG